MNTTPRRGGKNSPLGEQVYNRLLGRIRDGSWLPGDIFDRRSIAKELGVSIAPVGEAMVRLAQEGFIENMPRKGTRVRRCDPRRLYESLVMREAIECQAARMVHGITLSAKARELDELARMADGDGVDDTGRIEADTAFHKELVDCAGIGELSTQHDRLRLHILFDDLHLMRQKLPQPHSHQKLLKDLLKAKTPEAASELLRHHLRSGREEIINRFEKYK